MFSTKFFLFLVNVLQKVKLEKQRKKIRSNLRKNVKQHVCVILIKKIKLNL
jgi:hypothetical protein